MSKNTSKYNDEIDLLKLFHFLWDGKWIIITFLFLGLTIGFFLSLNKSISYESKIFYKIDILPPFYNEDKAITDFHQFFYSKKNFDTWKKKSFTDLLYEDFSKEKIIDGFIYSKDENDQFAKLLVNENELADSYLIIDTNNKNLLNDFYNYFVHTSDMLTSEYILTAKSELKLLDARLLELTNINIDFNSSLEELDQLSVDELIKFNIRDKLLTLDNNIIRNVLNLDRFIVAVENGQRIFSIQSPTYPKMISSRSSQLIIIFSILGVIVGLFFVMFIKVIRNKN